MKRARFLGHTKSVYDYQKSLLARLTQTNNTNVYSCTNFRPRCTSSRLLRLPPASGAPGHAGYAALGANIERCCTSVYPYTQVPTHHAKIPSSSRYHVERTPWPAHIPNSARLTVAGASAPRSSMTTVAPPPPDQPNDRDREWCSRKNKVRSIHQPATQRRRHALAGCSQGTFLHHSSADCGFQWMLPLWNSSCSFEGIRHGHFRRSEPPAHHICAGRFSRLSRQCTPYVRACREPLPLPVSQSMRAIPECPNDAFQLLMSCAQATARRDAERARIRSAVTRTARA